MPILVFVVVLMLEVVVGLLTLAPVLLIPVVMIMELEPARLVMLALAPARARC